MRLTEVLICIILFSIIATASSMALIAGYKSISKAEENTHITGTVLDADRFLRSTVKEIKVPYWKSLEGQKENIEEVIFHAASEKGIKVKSVSFVYEKDRNAELINLEWEINGRDYVTREYIRQRVFDE